VYHSLSICFWTSLSLISFRYIFEISFFPFHVKVLIISISFCSYTHKNCRKGAKRIATQLNSIWEIEREK
jgi:hypothetical protein